MVFCVLAVALRARAYVDITPSLGRIVNECRYIGVIEVEKVSREKRGIIYARVSDIKGEWPGKTIRHQLTDGYPPRPPRNLLDWARPGQRAVLFVAGPMALVCTGESWYQTSVPAGDEEWWRMSLDRPELALAYRGSVRRLADAVRKMDAGEEVVITTVAHGAQGRGSFSDVVFNTLQGGAPAPMQRIRGSLHMPPTLINIGNDPRWFVGMGAVTQDDLPRLLKGLASTDSEERLEAADDLRLLRPGMAQDHAAQQALEKQLGDGDAMVRLHVATALLTIDAKHAGARQVLVAGLSDHDAPVRLEAARSAQRLGRLPPVILKEFISGLDREMDDKVRWAMVETIGMQGSAAATAVEKIAALLDRAEIQACAAEALGRIGHAAVPALPRLAKLLESSEAQVQWAAARAMVLIGGRDAKPVVPFLVAHLEKAPRGRELYQLTWLLGLLGPVADDAVPALQAARWRDNELATMAIWAIRPRDKFPWQLGYRADRDCDLWLFADYIDRMGRQRTKDAALDLMEALLHGRAGWVPSWGYHLLAARAEATVPALVDSLGHAPPSQRIRAAKVLGEMGRAAAGAKAELEAAARSDNPDIARAAREALEKIKSGQ